MNIRLPKITYSFNTVVAVAIGIVAVVAIIFLVWLFGPSSHISVANNQNQQITRATSPLTGLPCPDTNRRPVTVMLSSDPEARPLSGIGLADMVFEMPVTPNGITRMMAVFQCNTDPTEVGSIRSARQDFIPLTEGLNAIYAHWGGEHGALEELNGHITDNVDGLLYEGTVYYRKKGIAAPHNGFTTLENIREKADALGYAASASLNSYTHETSSATPNLTALTDEVKVSWPQNMDVRFAYDQSTNTYLRWRGGQPEIDATTNKQVRVGVVAVLETDSSFLRDQYISVRTTGQGNATLYQDGRKVSATWKKPSATSMLTFTDTSGRQIPLATGPIWVIFNPPLPSI